MTQRTAPLLGRRGFLKAVLATPAALALGQLHVPPAGAATWRLHGDTTQRGQTRLYSGGDNRNAVCDTALQSVVPGPGALHAYWGGLYVNSVSTDKIRTGPFEPGTPPGARFQPGSGAVERMRWTTSIAPWQPEYRFTGRLYVFDILPRPQPYTGLVLQPIHLDNCNNYYVRLWMRDDPTKVDVKRESGDSIETFLRHGVSGDVPEPRLNQWYAYRVDVLPGSRFRFFWTDRYEGDDPEAGEPIFGDPVLDVNDPDARWASGPVGMRLDYFNVILADTRVYAP